MPKPKKSTSLATPEAVPGAPPPAPAEPVAEPPPLAVVEAHARYAEYLHLLDEVPVLFDVVSEPPRVVIRDFRLGQRPNVRKAARDDAYTVREQQAGELVQCYAEYALTCADEDGATAASGAKKKAKRQKGGKRSKRRKR